MRTGKGTYTNRAAQPQVHGLRPSTTAAQSCGQRRDSSRAAQATSKGMPLGQRSISSHVKIHAATSRDSVRSKQQGTFPACWPGCPRSIRPGWAPCCRTICATPNRPRWMSLRSSSSSKSAQRRLVGGAAVMPQTKRLPVTPVARRRTGLERILNPKTLNPRP